MLRTDSLDSRCCWVLGVVYSSAIDVCVQAQQFKMRSMTPFQEASL